MKVKVNGRVIREDVTPLNVFRENPYISPTFCPDSLVAATAEVRFAPAYDRVARAEAEEVNNSRLAFIEAAGLEMPVVALGQMGMGMGHGKQRPMEEVVREMVSNGCDAVIYEERNGQPAVEKIDTTKRKWWQKVPWRKVGMLVLIVGGTLLLTMGPTLLSPHVAAAATKAVDINAKFQPIVDLIKKIARPIAYGSLAYAGCIYILGQKEKAIQQIRGTIIGYLLVQWSPMLMDFIDSAGSIV